MIDTRTSYWQINIRRAASAAAASDTDTLQALMMKIGREKGLEAMTELAAVMVVTTANPTQQTKPPPQARQPRPPARPSAAVRQRHPVRRAKP